MLERRLVDEVHILLEVKIGTDEDTREVESKLNLTTDQRSSMKGLRVSEEGNQTWVLSYALR